MKLIKKRGKHRSEHRVKNGTDKRISLFEHLSELRRRFFICAIAVLVGSVITYYYVDRILEILRGPIETLVFIAPQEAFLVNLKLSFWGGVFLVSPIIFFEVWRFVSVALSEQEKRYLVLYGFLSFCSFLIGVTFAYLVVFPIGLKFLLSFTSSELQPMLSISKFVSFALMLLIVFGLIFELPLLTFFLTKLGLISPEFLTEKRKYAIIAMFIVAALLTPPDIFTQLLMAGPLLGLYEFSILVSKLAKRKEKIASEAEVQE
jgi:sec-independent protein translocase protein TatC